MIFVQKLQARQGERGSFRREHTKTYVTEGERKLNMQARQGERGSSRREHTKTYVTEGERKLNTVLRRMAKNQAFAGCFIVRGEQVEERAEGAKELTMT